MNRQPRSLRMVSLLGGIFAIVTLSVAANAQMTWQRALPTAWPPPGRGFAAAYDSTRGTLVVVGGGQWDSSRHETWLWNGKRWTCPELTSHPWVERRPGIVHDPARGRTVLFGAGDAGDETWEWDGKAWARPTPVTSPPGRHGAAMWYDAARGRVMLHGGVDAASRLFGDTWEYDGATWREVTPANGHVPAGGGSAVAWDPGRKRAVHFAAGRTWEWDGKAWRDVSPASGNPRPRNGHRMTYDPIGKRVLMFGGHAADRPHMFMRDLQAWDGKSWTRLAPYLGPPTKYPEALIHHAGRGRVLLFTNVRDTNRNELWEFDGKTWTQVTAPAERISARYDYAMAADPARRRVVLFGGLSWPGPLTCRADTWEWNGETWAKRKPVKSPPPRKRHAMAYDAVRRRVVLFGGFTSDSSGWRLLNDLWEWDGDTWRDVTPATGSPPVREFAALAYDTARRRLVLFGGRNHVSGILRDTWEWDGKAWMQVKTKWAPHQCIGNYLVYDAARRRLFLHDAADRTGLTWRFNGRHWKPVRSAAPAPPRRQQAALAYDPARQTVVLHGGWAWDTPIASRQSDTWEWDGTAWRPLDTGRRPGELDDDDRPLVWDAARGGLFAFSALHADGWYLRPPELTASTHVVSAAAGGAVEFALDAGAVHAGKGYVVLGCFDGATPRAMRIGRVTLPLLPDAYFRALVTCPGLLVRNGYGRFDARGRARAVLVVPRLEPACVGIRLVHVFVAYRSSIDFVSRAVPLEITP